MVFLDVAEAAVCLTVVLRCGFFLFSFESFVLYHLVIRNTKQLRNLLLSLK